MAIRMLRRSSAFSAMGVPDMQLEFFPQGRAREGGGEPETFGDLLRIPASIVRWCINGVGK